MLQEEIEIIVIHGIITFDMSRKMLKVLVKLLDFCHLWGYISFSNCFILFVLYCQFVFPFVCFILSIPPSFCLFYTVNSAGKIVLQMLFMIFQNGYHLQWKK